uniref:C-C motif chemokine n=1 Tax=Cyprinodon variegatus TaxID=28743 RepID=A0A3Q2D685_CYPVA
MDSLSTFSGLHFTSGIQSLIIIYLTPLFSGGIARAHCCFKFFPRPINKKRISSYYKTDARCHVNAIVLITKQSRRICVNSKRPWVVKIIDYLRS